ncbi:MULTISPECIES: phage terminase large subunit [Vibrio]|uniref:phage terminase large subunit n=1 Tax=Vibrio TaxID=662 RepID=UPI0004048609|nr:MULTISPECIES: phage terminase large subunit [Vibrio]MCS0207143.1 phage terminase large subunit [Vibrio sp. HS-50-1]HAS6597585.1 phage terminase large subunit [Vibrio parahaemolyticus]
MSINVMSTDYVQQLKEDFRLFLFAVWQFLNLPPPTDIQYDIAYHLQHGGKRIIIEAYRGGGKSWITSAFVCWLLLRNPQLRIMVVSASKERADSFSQFTKRLLGDMPILQHLKPTGLARDRMDVFDVAPAKNDHSPSVKSVGITGQLTGSRADIIIADDIEVLNNSATQDARDKLSELVKEFDAIIKPLDTSRIIYLGTPQTEMSIYNTLAERGYEVRIWPALYPNAEQEAAYVFNGRSRLAPLITKRVQENPELVGHTTDPKRFSDADLMERRVSYGKAGFSLQFMLDTALSDAEKYPLKLHDLIVTNVGREKAPSSFEWCNDPDKRCKELEALGLAGDYYYRPLWTSENFMPFTGRLLTIDPSGRGKDELAYNVTYFLNGYVFLTESEGLLEGYSEKNLKTLAETAKKHQVHKVLVESNFGDGMFTQLLKPWLNRIYPVSIEEVRQTAQKEQRIIDTLEPVLMQHRLVVDAKVIERDLEATQGRVFYSLFYQMGRITAERGALKHDDRLDALAMAVAYWASVMDADAKRIEQEVRAEALEKELADFIAWASGERDEPEWGVSGLAFGETGSWFN